MRIKRIGLFILLLVVTGCGERDPVTDSKTVFYYNESSGISSLDPAFARGQADVWACNQLFNGLVQLDDQLQVRPCIAHSWEVSNDGRTYTFHLRGDVAFHDNEVFEGGRGRRVTAADFVYSFSRLLLPSTASPGTWVFNVVERDSLGQPAFFAPDDSTLVIRLSYPFPPFPGVLTSQYCSVVPQEAINKYGKDFRKYPVGTGPFRFSFWEERTALVFLRNEHYFETENGYKLPYLDAVSISFLSDRQSAFLEFLKGNLDFISGIDASYKDELLTRSGTLRTKYRDRFEMITAPYLNTEYLGFLMTPESSLNDSRIRKAINYGFDRKQMIRYLRNNIGIPGLYGMVPPGLQSTDTASFTGYHYHPDSTAQLLRDAGFPGGKGLPEITLSTTREYLDLCEFMQGQLRESGIRIKLEVNQAAAHRELVAKQKLDFFRASWIADYPDAENYLSLYYSPNKAPAGPNYTHFQNALFDSLYQRASVTVNDSMRYRLYTAMDQLVMDQAPVVVLYYDEVIRLHGKKISGLGINGMNLLSLKKVKKQ